MPIVNFALYDASKFGGNIRDFFFVQNQNISVYGHNLNILINYCNASTLNDKYLIKGI